MFHIQAKRNILRRNQMKSSYLPNGRMQNSETVSLADEDQKKRRWML